MSTTYQSLSTAEDYFLNVLQPNYHAFYGAPSSFATAINLATTLYHFNEWLLHQYESELAGRFGFTKVESFWSKVEKKNQKFGYIRDVANASKHVQITRKPSTGTTHISDLHIVPSGFGSGAWGVGRYGGANMECQDDSALVSFDDCAEELYVFWKVLLEQLTGNAYP